MSEKIANYLLMVFMFGFSQSVLASKINVVTEHLAPFQIVSEDGIGGISTEIVKATLDTSGIDYQLDAFPWALSYKRAQQEENTCIYSLAKIPERIEQFQWVGHITNSTTSFYALSSSTVNIDRLEDAKNYRTAVINSDVTHHFLLSKGFVENKNLYVMNNYDALLQLLEVPSRHIDLVILNDDLIRNRFKNAADVEEYKSVYLLKELTLNFYLACSNTTDSKIVSRLKETMEILEKSGRFKEIRQAWQAKLVTMF